jgi:hypothetical protein
MSIKAYPINETETIEVKLDRNKTPISFKHKVDELMEQGAFDTREEAESWVEETPIVLEMMYEKHSGLFAVESEAIESGVFSPYTREEIEVED